VGGGKNSQVSATPYVHHIEDNSPAARDGRVRVGDKILEINGESVASDTNFHLAARLAAPSSMLRLKLSRCVA
jgi:C-terminal processing protease CtpA/Prc